MLLTVAKHLIGFSGFIDLDVLYKLDLDICGRENASCNQINPVMEDLTLSAPVLLKSLNELNRGSYMSACVLLNLLNKLGKRDKMRGLQ